MKPIKFTNILVLGLVLTLAATGCKKTPVGVTKIPGNSNVAGEGKQGQGPGQEAPLPPGPKQSETDQQIKSTEVKPAEGIPQSNTDFSKYTANSEILKSDTVYFDFDSSALKSAERAKLTAVVDYLKSHATDAVRVEGNCDERGTEEYNRSLGERRALAAREELVHMGVDANRVVTISYGKDKPAETGHDDAAWKLNRRDDFVVLTPPAAP